MDPWGDIRLRARAHHQRALEEAGGDRRGRALVTAALKLGDLVLAPYDPGTKAGPGVFGFLERGPGIVNIARGQAADQEVVVIAHELGHSDLHTDPSSEVTNVEAQLGGDAIDSGAGRVEGYSPHDRKEVQADIFAGEFLCPGDWLRDALTTGGRLPSEVAAYLGLPPALVLNQALRALLLPPLEVPASDEPGEAFELDPSQKEAATWNKGPLLVNAGPGTGKTRTLVERIGHILETEPNAGSILALTFSKKAAEEMRGRLAVSHPDAAIEMWVGTFHAFGLELVTKWPSRAKRTDQVKILDQTASLALLERNLSSLPLHHYQNLFEPAYELVHVLQAISRCKDEMISPAAYLADARAALESAPDDARESAEKAVELGEIYEIYEQALEAEDSLDFGDLVLVAGKLLHDHVEIKAQYREQFRHILVDEYQDVNLASAFLLRELAGDGRDVWVVADQRQAIYRFRGAQPINCTRFKVDFEGEERSLKVNYRSGAPVVRTFEAFAGAMSVKRDDSQWTANRGDVGGVSLTVAPTLAAEGQAIRDQIEAFRKAGVPYREQLILARSHLTLARITAALEALGVPLLYLGDLFERPEIRDLLSLVAIDAEFGGVGLARVAGLPEYGVSAIDAIAVIRWAQESKGSIFEILADLPDELDLSDGGRAGLARLGNQLRGMGPTTSPWTLLTTWLFERSAYLKPLLAADDAKSRQKLIAIYHLLKVCSEQMATGHGMRKRLLERIRRIEALNHDTPYRAVSSEATNMDAVRVMTVHGSKGLEFGAVHLPALATRYMPSVRQGVRCPPPASLPQLGSDKADHDAEEECLFFVALSRARDFLSISRAERYTSVGASASKFLPSLAHLLPPRRQEGAAGAECDEAELTPAAAKDNYEERELDTYFRCPRRYRYEKVDGLRGSDDSSAYLRFHRCVYRTIGWLEEQRSKGASATPQAALEQLEREWQKNGPIDHGFEQFYRRAAVGMIEAMAGIIASETGDYARETWCVPVGGRKVLILPDRVVVDQEGAVHVQRLRTGRKTKSEPDNRIYALLRVAGERRYPDKAVHIETFYPATREAVAVPPKNDDKKIADYAEAIEAIERGEFPIKPKDNRQCPNCPCYFICGL